ncbi:hypothetical protein Lal_00022437 [Lupinus albus]|nr:hypothetical protein Lal_00022437 [Lupinus albus]
MDWNPKGPKPPAKNEFGDIFICLKCGKSSHIACKCKSKPMNVPPEANMIGESLVACYDCVSHHVCYDRVMFKTYTKVDDKKVLLGDFHITVVVGTGYVKMKFTSGKTLILKNVMHTLEMRNNLVGFTLDHRDRLNKAGLKYDLILTMYN